MDRALDQVQSNCLQLLVSIWTWFQGCMDWCSRSYRGIIEAHQPEIWFFLDQNHTPFITRNPDCYPTSYNLIYNPQTKAFSDNKHHHRTHRMDVLSAELFCPTTSQRWDIAEHLTQISWKGSYAPSIYEMILCWMLEAKNPPFSHLALSKMKLRIETATTELRTYSLSSHEIMRRYQEFFN